MASRPRRLMFVAGVVAGLVTIAAVLVVWRPWVTEAQDSPCVVLDELAFSLESTLGSGIVDASGLPALTDRLQTIPDYGSDPFAAQVLSAVSAVLSAEPEGVLPAADAALDAVAVARADQKCEPTPAG